MSTARSRTTRTSFLCIARLASSNSWARHHFAWNIKSLATVPTKFSASSLTLNQSFPNPYKTSLLGVAFTRQETSRWQLKHRSLHSSQMKSNRLVYGCNHTKMENVVSNNFPKFSEGSHKIKNSGDYDSHDENGILYADIRLGKYESIETGRKFDIHYTLFGEKKNFIHEEDKKETTLEKLGTGLREGIKGMMSDGRRLIIVPPDLADHQYVNKGEYAIYDVTIR